MKISIVHMLLADWYYIGCPTDTVRIKTTRMSVLGTYMNSIYMLIS